jgi:hypothetical protein
MAERESAAVILSEAKDMAFEIPDVSERSHMTWRKGPTARKVAALILVVCGLVQIFAVGWWGSHDMRPLARWGYLVMGVGALCLAIDQLIQIRKSRDSSGRASVPRSK